MKKSDSGFSGDAWYNAAGEDDDVVVSSRVRLARNLANFPFPGRCHQDDSERIQNIIFDSFNHFEDAEAYLSIEISSLEKIGEKILCERGLIEPAAAGKKRGSGLINRLDGISACLVNSVDHVRISSFSTGLACNSAFVHSSKIDQQLQESVQFAASYEFGFLTSSVNDAGSGMKSSIRVHIPSIAFGGKIKELAAYVNARGFSISDCFGAGNETGTSLGNFYQISTSSSMNGNEVDQLAAITSLGKYICELERKSRESIVAAKSTIMRDRILRALAKAKFCILLNLRESIELVSDLKWAYDVGFVRNMEEHDFNSLLYRIQPGHVEFLIRSGSFNFEDDVISDAVLKENRIRAVLIQKNFDKLEIDI